MRANATSIVDFIVKQLGYTFVLVLSFLSVHNVEL